MTGSQRMRNAVGAAQHVLDAEACRRVRDYVRAQRTPDGGFRGRGGDDSDLYYAVFGAGCLGALERGRPVPGFAEYVARFGEGKGLDFVHLCCLARCLSIAPDGPARGHDRAIVERIDACRTPDGGFHPQGPDRPIGSAYAAFLALLAHEDLGVTLPDAERLLDSLATLRSGDGGYGNVPGMDYGTTTATTASLFLQHRLGRTADARAMAWLQTRFDARGGVTASPIVRVPDLLSTATTVFTLAALGVDLTRCAENVVAMVELLWNDDGGFGMAPMHGASDCEYTFYALLTLGVLAGDGYESA